MVPSWKMSQQCLNHSSLSLPTIGYYRAKKMKGKRRRGKREREGRNSSFNAKVLLEQCVWFLQGAIYILKGKHAVIKYFCNPVPSTSKMREEGE